MKPANPYVNKRKHYIVVDHAFLIYSIFSMIYLMQILYKIMQKYPWWLA